MHKNFKFKLFVKLYIYYVCAFVIPFSIIAIILTQVVMPQYNNDVTSLFMNITDHITSVMDTDLYSAENALSVLKRSSSVLELANEVTFDNPHSIYAQKKLTDELQIFQSNQNANSDLHIFFSKSQTIFTPANKYTLPSYYNRIYKGTPYTIEDVTQILSSGDDHLLQTHSENSGATEVIAIVKPIFMDLSGNCITLITNIDTSAIFNTYSSITKNLSEAYFAISNTDNTMTFNSKNIPEEIDFPLLTKSPPNTIMRFGDEYLALRQPSAAKDLNYYFIFSEAEILAKSNKIENLLMLLIAIISVLLLFVAYVASCRSFSPVSVIIANSKSDESRLQLNSYDNIKNLVTDIITTNNSLRLSVENQKKCITDNLFKMFIQNSLDMSQESLNTLFNDCPKAIACQHFNAVIVDIIDFGNVQSDAAKLLIINALRSHAESTGAFLVPIPGDTGSIIIMLSHNMSDDKIKEILTNAYNTATANNHISVCINIGKQVDGISLFSKSYESALNGARMKKSGVRLDTIKTFSANEMFFSHNDKTQLINHVVAGNKSLVYEFFDRFMTEIFITNTLTYDALISLRYALADSLNEVIYNNNIPNANQIISDSSVIHSETDIVQSFKMLSDLYLSVTDIMFESKNNTTYKLRNIIDDYIEKNYSRPDISLKVMADEIHYSSSHLYKFFKTEIGMVFVDYLHKIRIEKAKELILKTQKPINEISAEVGYLSANSFTKIFKKINGITPGEFRKNSSNQ